MYGLLAGELSPRPRYAKAPRGQELLRRRAASTSSLPAAAVLYGSPPYSVPNTRDERGKTRRKQPQPLGVDARRQLSPRCRRSRAGLGASSSPASMESGQSNMPNTKFTSVQETKTDQAGARVATTTDLNLSAGAGSGCLQPEVDTPLQTARHMHQTSSQIVSTEHGTGDDNTLIYKPELRLDTKNFVRTQYAVAALDITNQFLDALYLFAEASWSCPDEVVHNEQAGKHAIISQELECDQPKNRHRYTGPGDVVSYEVPSHILSAGDDGTGLKPSISTSSQLLWFSLVHQLTLLLIGSIAWWTTGSRLWIGHSTYLIVGLGLWCTHWFGHRRWFWRAWFNEHTIGHHVKAYPPSKFLSERYVSVTQRAAGKLQKPSTGLGLEMSINTMVYLPWPVFAALLHCQATTECTATEAGLVLLIGLGICLEQEIVHRAVHTHGCWLERYRWFQTMRALHFLHHKDGMQHNYAMIDFFLDIVSGNLINSV